jgi:hypothetical protein
LKLSKGEGGYRAATPKTPGGNTDRMKCHGALVTVGLLLALNTLVGSLVFAQETKAASLQLAASDTAAQKRETINRITLKSQGKTVAVLTLQQDQLQGVQMRVESQKVNIAVNASKKTYTLTGDVKIRFVRGQQTILQMDGDEAIMDTVPNEK